MEALDGKSIIKLSSSALALHGRVINKPGKAVCASVLEEATDCLIS